MQQRHHKCVWPKVLSYSLGIRTTSLLSNSTCILVTTIHTCQFSGLHLQRLQPYRDSEILLTQRNRHIKKHLPKHSQPLICDNGGLLYTSPEPFFDLFFAKTAFFNDVTITSSLRSVVQVLIGRFTIFQSHGLSGCFTPKIVKSCQNLSKLRPKYYRSIFFRTRCTHMPSSCLHVQLLQRYRDSEILLTQRYRHKQLPKYSKRLT